MTGEIETIIIGGGQAGLATSYYLGQLEREHLVLEQSSGPGNAWRNRRWDSFVLNTPNWTFQLPGAEYRGEQPDDFLTRAEIVAIFDRVVDKFHLPVQYNTRVISVELQSNGKYIVNTSGGSLEAGLEAGLEAEHVVVATGLFQRSRKPTFAAGLSPNIVQLSSDQYRAEDKLPPGAVLVVGSAQSGCQIAEELYQNGRQVYLCVGSAGRAPRRYRGRDIFEWLDRTGYLSKRADQLVNPSIRFQANPTLTGVGGGHTLNLHQFARDGVILLGRIRAGEGDRIALEPDLQANLALADRVEADITRLVDTYIAHNGIDAPGESLPVLRDGFEAEERLELDLGSAGVTSIIWAMGYGFDFNLVRLPVLDPTGFPVTQRGATAFDGLYFMGLPWLQSLKSGLLLGVGEDAEYVASQIGRSNARKHGV